MKTLIFLIYCLAMMLNGELLADTEVKSDEMLVYRSATCGCCGKWLEHVKQHQFNVKAIVSDDMQAVKDKLGVPDKLASCHTAVINGYVIEGHVPAEDIKRLLHIKPSVQGIAAPGMPMGSPGMESGDYHPAYQVMSYDKEGHIVVFSSHGEH